MTEVRIPVLGYRGRTLARDIRLDIAPGECILLAGANGCGKTTLLRAMAGGMAFFLPTGIPKVKGFTVREFIRTACYRESGWRLSPALEERITEALAILGITALDGRDLSTLSDGEFQKACLAIGLTRRAELLLLDEPTAFLDVEARRSVLAAVRGLSRRSGLAVVFSSHDLVDALSIADRVAGFTPDGQFLVSDGGNREAVLDRFFHWR